MDFKQAIETCLRKKYADFSGRASRSEFWWFSLFTTIILAVILVIGRAVEFVPSLAGVVPLIFGFLILVVAIGLIVPGLAVSVRRLHDTGKSGWLILIGIIPIVSIVGSWVLLVFYVLPSDAKANAYGEPPLASPAAA